MLEVAARVSELASRSSCRSTQARVLRARVAIGHCPKGAVHKPAWHLSTATRASVAEVPKYDGVLSASRFPNPFPTAPNSVLLVEKM